MLDKIKRGAIAVAIVVLAQFVVAGPSPTAAWWRASAGLAGSGFERLSGFVEDASAAVPVE